MADTNIIDYSVTDAALAELKAKYGGLRATFGDGMAYKSVTDALSVVRTLRINVEKKRVELKADALEYGRKVDAEAKRITAALLEVEEPLKANKEEIDAEKERLRAEKAKKEQDRVDGIMVRIADFGSALAACSTQASAAISAYIATLDAVAIDESFQEFQQQAAEAKAAALEKMNLLLAGRLELEEQDRKRREEDERLKAERAALDSQRAEMEARQAAEAAKQQAERDRLAAEQRKIDEEKAAIQRQKEREEFEKQAKERAEAEAAAKLAAAEAAKKAEVERLAAEKAAEEALKPDLVKLRAHIQQAIDGVPEMKTAKGKKIASKVQTALSELLSEC